MFMCEKLMIYSGGTWAMSVKYMMKLERTEMRMLRLMYAIRLQDRLTNADLRNRFGIECIGDHVSSSRFRWFGYVERKP